MDGVSASGKRPLEGTLEQGPKRQAIEGIWGRARPMPRSAHCCAIDERLVPTPSFFDSRPLIVLDPDATWPDINCIFSKEAFAAFLQTDPCVDSKTHHGESLLHLAARFGNLAAMNHLLDHIDVNCQDAFGRTPLHHASAANQKSSIVFLVTAGADLNMQTRGGKTPLEEAAFNLHDLAIRALLDLGAEKSEKTLQLAKAAQMRQSEEMRKLLER